MSSSEKEPLIITSVEIEGADAGRFSLEERCDDGTELTRGEECVLRIAFAPGDTAAQATLVIHQNLAGPAPSVALQGEAATLNPSPTPT
ncbi:hypothetical protein [Promicromonospora sp. NPDC019610]|uniref:hypothetical protein n=1 Tax=Promicromonospora sp. NPDC019610 TaxID=3364405 RepID=UPI00379A5B49